MEHSKDLKAVTFYTQRNSFGGKEEEEKKVVKLITSAVIECVSPVDMLQSRN